MATWTYDLTTETGAVRLNIGDSDITPTTDAHFNDEEIAVFLANAAGLGLAGVWKTWAASGFALIAWAVALAREDEMVDTGSWKGDRRDVAGKMNAKAKEYMALAGVDEAQATPLFYSVPVDWNATVASERELTEDGI